MPDGRDGIAVSRNIQGLRGIAASMVLLGHVPMVDEHLRMGLATRIVWAFAYAGVDLFFVISGFIIFRLVLARTASMPGAFAPGEAFDFAWKRVLRIYPLYWIVLLCSIPAGQLISPFAPDGPNASLPALVSLAAVKNYLVPAAWSLSFEVYFYFVFFLIILVAGRHLMLAVIVWFVGQALLIGFADEMAVYSLLGNFGRIVLINPIIAEFAMGIGVAWLIARGERRFAIPALAAGLLLFAVAVVASYRAQSMGQVDLGWRWRADLFGPAAALVVYGLVALELNGRWVMPALLQRLGDASYSIYLWQLLALALLRSGAQRLGLYDVIPKPVLGIAWVLAVWAWGWTSYRLIETPLHALARRMRWRTQTRPAASISPVPSLTGPN